MKKVLEEFKKFISRGNVLDLAVGVIIGGAFSGIVTSLVNNIFTPLIGVIFGGVNFSHLSLKVGDAYIMYGAFLQTVFDFFITAVCLFLIVKLVNRFNSDIQKISKKDKKNGEVKVEAPKKSDDVLLLEEIRDLLKENNKKKGNK